MLKEKRKKGKREEKKHKRLKGQEEEMAIGGFPPRSDGGSQSPILPLYLTHWGQRGNSVGQRSFLPSPPSSSTPFDFSCLKQPCPSSSPLSKELDLHGFWIYHFSIISTIGLTPCPFSARKSSWQNGVWAPQSPALYPCTVSVLWILFFLGYS